MHRLKIIEKQKKILIFSGIVLAAFVIFIILIYLPAKSRLAELKKEYSLIQSEIDEFKKSLGDEESMEQVILSMKKKLDLLDRKFSEKEEDVLKEISVLAGNLGVEIASIRPERKRVIKEIDKYVVNIKECVVQEMPIYMNLKASYRMAGEFLKDLKENCPVFIDIQNVSMVKHKDKASELLDVTMNINTYLVCPEK